VTQDTHRREVILLDGSSVFVAALPQNSRGICFLIDRLVDEASLLLSRLRERRAGMTLRRIFGWHIHTSHLKYEDISSLVDLL
jgi:hypothetical protein